jgi:nucleoside 2-deoxyribosyltransferase
MKETYTAYAAGGLFTQHELMTNVLIKEAVWEISKGKFALVLPQSKELRNFDRPDIDAHIRNHDLLQVVKTDLILARYDGLELDAGTVVEYMAAKFLGKPAVLLRCDFRGLDSNRMDSPYNLMTKNWPRTVEVHVDSLSAYAQMMFDGRQREDYDGTFAAEIQTELETGRKGVRALAKAIVEGLDAALLLPSPYPEKYREQVYAILRHRVGSGFDAVFSEEALQETIDRLTKQGTL